MTNFFSLGSKITVDVTAAMKLEYSCSSAGNLDSVLESKDTALLTKVHRVEATVFPGVTYSCESWTIKKSER